MKLRDASLRCIASPARKMLRAPDEIWWSIPESATQHRPRRDRFTGLLFAFAGIGTIAGYFFTLLRPDLRTVALGEYFNLAFVLVANGLIFFGGGYLTFAIS